MAEKMTLKMVRDEMRMIQGNVRVTCTKENVGEWADAIDAHLAQPAQAVDVRAVTYAERLARALWREYYADDAPQWEPLTGELMGLLSQIENMTTGLTRAIGNAQAEGWRDIATAPRDTRILICREGDECSHAGFWQEAIEDGVDYMGADAGFVDVDFQNFCPPRSFGHPGSHYPGRQPTLWMPLPAPARGMTMPMNEEVRKAVEYADGIFDGCDNGEWQTIRAELTRLTEIADAVDPLVIRLGEVTTRIEAADALLRTIRGCINETRGAYAGDVVREIDAHLSEPRT